MIWKIGCKVETFAEISQNDVIPQTGGRSLYKDGEIVPGMFEIRWFKHPDLYHHHGEGDSVHH